MKNNQLNIGCDFRHKNMYIFAFVLIRILIDVKIIVYTNLHARLSAQILQKGLCFWVEAGKRVLLILH